jgi:hypothetical protein
MKKILFLLLLSVGLVAEAQAKPYLVTGRMDYLADLEGGCWFLSAEDGQKYQLMGTEAQLEKIRVIGRNVKLEVEDVNNMASVCMSGKPVRIIRVVDQVGFPIDLPYMTVKATGRIYKTKAGCWYLKTTKGQKYDLELANIPRAKRKSGARVKNQSFRIFMDKKASECGLDGKATFIFQKASAKEDVRSKAPLNKAMEQRRADPR